VDGAQVNYEKHHDGRITFTTESQNCFDIVFDCKVTKENAGNKFDRSFSGQIWPLDGSNGKQIVSGQVFFPWEDKKPDSIDDNSTDEDSDEQPTPAQKVRDDAAVRNLAVAFDMMPNMSTGPTTMLEVTAVASNAFSNEGIPSLHDKHPKPELTNGLASKVRQQLTNIAPRAFVVLCLPLLLVGWPASITSLAVGCGGMKLLTSFTKKAIKKLKEELKRKGKLDTKDYERILHEVTRDFGLNDAPIGQAIEEFEKKLCEEMRAKTYGDTSGKFNLLKSFQKTKFNHAIEDGEKAWVDTQYKEEKGLLEKAIKQKREINESDPLPRDARDNGDDGDDGDDVDEDGGFEPPNDLPDGDDERPDDHDRGEDGIPSDPRDGGHDRPSDKPGDYERPGEHPDKDGRHPGEPGHHPREPGHHPREPGHHPGEPGHHGHPGHGR